MKFKDDESRNLFLRYAIPCSETLAKRGVITKTHQRRLMEAVLFDKKIPKNSENIFKVANLMCERTAKKLGKRSIDKDVIRKYFLFSHDKVVDERFKKFRDFDAMECRVYSGKVLNSGDVAMVKTIIGKKKYKTGIKLKKGDSVVVHRDFVIEKIDDRLAKKLWNLKQIYLKSNKI